MMSISSAIVVFPTHLAAARRVRAVHVALQDLAGEAEVGDLAHELRVDQHVPAEMDNLIFC